MYDIESQIESVGVQAQLLELLCDTFTSGKMDKDIYNKDLDLLSSVCSEFMAWLKADGLRPRAVLRTMCTGSARRERWHPGCEHDFVSYQIGGKKRL